MSELPTTMPKPGAISNKFQEVHDVQEVAKLIEEMGLTLRSELQLIKDAMAPGQKMMTRLAAQKQLRQLYKDIRMASTVLVSMTRRSDGSVEHQAIAPALMDDLIRENQDAETPQESPYRHLTPVKRAVDRDPRAAGEAGFSNKALEGALRRSLGPIRGRDIALDLTKPEPAGGEPEGTGSADGGDVPAGAGGPADGGGAQPGVSPVLRTDGPVSPYPEPAHVWPPTENDLAG